MGISELSIGILRRGSVLTGTCRHTFVLSKRVHARGVFTLQLVAQ
jgi:hypothetical protein